MAADSVPDFEDLLAAFDIPDVTVRIREATPEDGPDGGDKTTEDSDQKKEKEVDKESSNGNKEQSPSTESTSQNGESEPTEPEAAKEQETTPDDKESNNSDQVVTNPTEDSTVSETSISTGIDKIARISIPIANISPPLTQEEKNNMRKPVVEKPKIEKIVIVTPNATTSGFKNTSSDGPKILNVTGGVNSAGAKVLNVTSGGKVISIPMPTAKGTNVTNAGPIILRQLANENGTTTVYQNGKQANAKVGMTVQNSPVGQVYKVSSVTGGQSMAMAVKVNHVDPIEEEMKMLSRKQIERTNPIARFTMTPPPDDLELDIEIPVGGYKCEECGDSYALESSLQHHMDRRSVKIMLNCVFCRMKCEFYNKCSMHAHIRNHKITNMKPVLDATVSPLDSISGTKSRPKLDAVFNQTEKSATESPLQKARRLLSEKLTKPQSITPKIKLDSLDASKCPVCSCKLDCAKNLGAHLQEKSKGDIQHHCQHCNMHLTNDCQLQLHISIHSTTRGPWLCPECGCVFKNYDQFESHINLVCFHFNRNAVFHITCSICKIKHTSQTSYHLHLLAAHKHSFYKCISCKLAFRSIEILKQHNLTQHSFPGPPCCSIIYKCALCDTVFTQHAMLETHIRTHTTGFTPTHFNFKCSDCNFVSLTTWGLMTHQGKNTSHKKRLWYHCDICRQKWSKQEAVRLHRTMQHKGYKTIPLNSNAKTEERNGSLQDNSSNPGKSDGPTGDQAPNDQQGAPKVIIKRMLRCPGCKALGVDIYFKKERNLRNHISRHHSHMDPNSIRPEFVEYVPFYPGGKGNAKVFEQDEGGAAEVPAGLKRKRQQETEASAKRIKKLREDKLSCAKCKFESKDRIEFGTHIDKHREGGDVSQCQECGLCFRVINSLHKHLFIKHQIRDVSAYAQFQTEVLESIEKFKAAQVEETKEKETGKETVKERSVSPCNPLECTVCHKVFDSEVLKKNHMRSHGMAFIKAKNKTQ